MDAFKTHGAFSWSELSTTDPKAASAFYTELFGWTSKAMDMEMGPYHVLNVGDAAVGGIMGMPPSAPPGMPPVWGCYITVDDCEASVSRCTALGGKTIVPPMDVPGVGRMAVLQDPQGAIFNVITYVSG